MQGHIAIHLQLCLCPPDDFLFLFLKKKNPHWLSWLNASLFTTKLLTLTVFCFILRIQYAWKMRATRINQNCKVQEVKVKDIDEHSVAE